MAVEQQARSRSGRREWLADDVPAPRCASSSAAPEGYVDKNYGEVAHNIRTAKVISPDDEKASPRSGQALTSQFKA